MDAAPPAQRIRTVVNIGIGGSDLGPAMAYRALDAFRHPELACRFVSNVDGADIAGALADLDPAETLFVVSSKTFTTIETLTNARTARAWLVDALGEDAVATHFVAVSTNAEEVAAFGIDTANMFGFWDWVGGRYSVDSAIGLSLMIAIGPDRFAEFLAGFHTIDEHFRTAPLAANAPVLLGMIGDLERATCSAARPRRCCRTPRSSRRFPAYLQQLDMESNGKSVRLDGSPVTLDTGPIVWGEPGTNGQHAFYQLLHQGTGSCPPTSSASPTRTTRYRHHHDLLVANLIAQTEALAFGRDRPDEPWRVVRRQPADDHDPRPELTPSVLGQLIALYEHIVFVQGVRVGHQQLRPVGRRAGQGAGQPDHARADGRRDAASTTRRRAALIDWYRATRLTASETCAHREPTTARSPRWTRFGRQRAEEETTASGGRVSGSDCSKPCHGCSSVVDARRGCRCRCRRRSSASVLSSSAQLPASGTPTR